jgi:VanZ family protein
LSEHVKVRSHFFPPKRMFLNFNRQIALGLLTALVLVLLVGTLIPGPWRNALEASLHAPIPLAKLAHLLVFMAIAFVVRVPALSWPVLAVLAVALGLGSLTEGLQLLAVQRDASVHDVGIDLLGACTGLVFAQAVREFQKL